MATSLGCEAMIGAFGFLGSLICVLEVKQEPCSVTKSPRGIIIFFKLVCGNGTDLWADISMKVYI